MEERKREIEAQKVAQNLDIEERRREMKAFRDNVNRFLGKWDHRWGRFVEILIKTGTARLLDSRGIKVDQVIHRFKDRIHKNPHWEIDILAQNSILMVAIEAKYHLSKEDVDDAIETFKQF